MDSAELRASQCRAADGGKSLPASRNANLVSQCGLHWINHQIEQTRSDHPDFEAV